MNLGQLFAQLWAVIKQDEAQVILPALAKFFDSVAKNPTAINFAAAFAQLQVDVLAAQPGIEQSVLAEIAAVVDQAAQAANTPPAPAPAPAAAKT